MKTIKAAPQWLVILAFANVYILWGSTYLAVLYGLEGFPPFLMSALRYLAAGILLFAWCCLKQEKFPSLKNVASLSFSGIIMLVGGSGLIAWSEQHIASGKAAILIATEPFWFVLLDRKSWGTYFSNKFIISGLIIGFIGILLFFKLATPTSNNEGSHVELIATIVLLVSAVLWVLGTLINKNKATAASVVMKTSVQLLAAGVFSGLLSLTLGEWTGFSFFDVSWRAWGGLIFLITMGSLVAFLSFIWLISIRSPALVSTHTYVNPVVAVILGWALANESISLWQTLTLFIILVGILLINIPSYKKGVGV